MNQAIIAQLQDYARKLANAQLAEVDVKQLCQHLAEAAATVESLLEKAQLADSLFKLFRDDLLTRAHAVAKLTGNSSRLIERLINSEQISLEELLTLKRDIEAAFDSAFTSALKDANATQSDDQDKLAQFKIG
ncbi:MAG: hypothetical protein WBP29_05300 [Candidatus Zixiibacteriota bacterium]